MSTSETINFHFLFICFPFHFTPRNLNLLKLCSNWLESFCDPTKILPERASVNTKKRLGRPVCDGAKLRPGSDLYSGEPGGGGGYCHIWAIQVYPAVKGIVFKQFTQGLFVSRKVFIT